MPDPHDTLSIFAEVSVALAGFSGIIITFSDRAFSSMTPLVRRRLSNLFACSGTILISSLLGISLLHVESLERSVLWIAMSLLLLTLGTSWLLLDRQRVSHLDAHERSHGRFSSLSPTSPVLRFNSSS